jgi:hypothetical protein
MWQMAVEARCDATLFYEALVLESMQAPDRAHRNMGLQIFDPAALRT